MSRNHRAEGTSGVSPEFNGPYFVNLNEIERWKPFGQRVVYYYTNANVVELRRDGLWSGIFATDSARLSGEYVKSWFGLKETPTKVVAIVWRREAFDRVSGAWYARVKLPPIAVGPAAMLDEASKEGFAWG